MFSSWIVHTPLRGSAGRAHFETIGNLNWRNLSYVYCESIIWRTRSLWWRIQVRNDWRRDFLSFIFTNSKDSVYWVKISIYVCNMYLLNLKYLNILDACNSEPGGPKWKKMWWTIFTEVINTTISYNYSLQNMKIEDLLSWNTVGSNLT